MKNINVDLLSFQSELKFREEKGKRFIFCLIRQRYLVLTPEEIVRQLMLLYLIGEKHYPKNRIAVEKQLKINGRKKRFDILVLDKEVQPIVLVECKAPNVPISQATFNQIAQYNLTLNSDILILSNGKITYCCTMNHERRSYDFLDGIPSFV
ncbi:MAG: type I site-specific restriction-modification system R (restriction) subunit [Saprospiraceae bacterium]|jgi:type I site-specific restriction-modification system R (restriction) subunit